TDMNNNAAFQVVVGVDGSPQSHRALEWAITEARLRHGHVKVVTAWQFPATALGLKGMAQELESVERTAHQIQRRTLIGVHLEGVTVTTEVHEGPPASVLINASRDADLLVVGSHGYEGVSALLLGSVSNQIAHHAPCPVLIVRPRPGPSAAP
ncbi:MAG: universal stress protein, partial [Rhodococcus sp. (in: high G+C Gram-positive bacteria)]|nr:universal stress protein [Rhodococcus sp. (in: high G+C Gram-positive bacteria)]